MGILKQEYMTPNELEFFQAIEDFSDHLYKAYCENMNEDELSFAGHLYEILNNYSWNLFEQNKLNEMIYSIKDPKEWKTFFSGRAKELGRLYQENEAILREVKDCLEKPMNKMTAGLWVELLRIHFNNRGIGDLHCTMPILNKVIPYLEEYEDWQGLCLAYIFYANFSFATMYHLNDETPILYAKKLIGIRNHYKEMKTPYSIYDAYGDVYTFGLKNGNITPEETFDYVKEMQQFMQSQELDEGIKQRCMVVYETCIDYWVATICPYADEASPELKNHYCKLAKNRYHELTAQNVPFEQQLFPYYAYELHAEVIDKEISWDNALTKLFAYYRDNFVPYFDDSCSKKESKLREDFENQNIQCGINENQEVMNSLIELAVIMERWTHKCPNSEISHSVTKILICDIPKFYHFYTNVPLEMSQLLTDLCFSLMPCLPNADAKEHWVLELVTKKQFATHLHSVMVQKIAVAVASSLYEKKPELFDTVKQQIGDRPLIDFISKCALFHDVGKNDIATIVNVQARALDDAEFMAIKQHPYFGFHRFLNDSDFSCYKDVVLFHHKTYDGKGGYPADADNTLSPYKIVADLITICDCLDAATDTLGRNYKHAKTVEELLAELDRDAGTRYNPDIVSCIKNDPALVSELKKLIVNDRINIAYEIASHY